MCIRDRYTISWALGAFEHMVDSVDLLAVLDKLGYSRAFTDRKLQRQGMAAITGVEYVPEEDEAEFGPETYIDVPVDEELQEQYVERQDE